jgi:hypothetical protein
MAQLFQILSHIDIRLPMPKSGVQYINAYGRPGT